MYCRGQLICDGTRAETRFSLSAKRRSLFKSAGASVLSTTVDSVDYCRLLAAEVCASAVAMLDKPCSEVVWRVLATHSIRKFPLHFPSRASPCAITFHLDSTTGAFATCGRCCARKAAVKLMEDYHKSSGQLQAPTTSPPCPIRGWVRIKARLDIS